jgi:IS5 family transposase
MKGKKADFKQGRLFQDDLLEHLNPKNPLLLLSKKIPWDTLESELSGLYSNVGRPAKPIRLMCGLMILKQLHNLSDDNLIEAWLQNP